MNIIIRKMKSEDSEVVIDMMRRFYNSPALITDGSEEIFAANVKNCLNDSACVEGFVIAIDDKIIGYGMTARSYSTEFGGECIWIEDIFIEDECRGHGIGSKFIRHIRELYPVKIFRLEADKDNDKALKVYKRLGFKELPYLELVCNGD